MEAATEAGGIVSRASAAHAAGCDVVLVCNRPDLNEELLAGWTVKVDPQLHDRLSALRGRAPAGTADERASAKTRVAALSAMPDRLA